MKTKIEKYRSVDVLISFILLGLLFLPLQAIAMDAQKTGSAISESVFQEVRRLKKALDSSLEGQRSDLKMQLQGFLREHFSISVQIAGPHALEVEAAISDRLRQQGFTVVEGGVLVVSGTVIFEKTGPRSRTVHFMRWRTRILLQETHREAIFATIRRTGREGQPSAQKVEQKALLSLQSALSETVLLRIGQYVFSD